MHNYNNFCIRPWVHSCIKTNGNIMLCCLSQERTEYNIKTSSVASWWTSDFISDIRQQFLNNEQPAACRSCFREEQLGGTSLRQKSNKEYKIIENIKILDYLPETELVALYLLSDALVMPTYFGPTNIPPLEAWHLKIPVVYSSYLRNHGDSAALYFNPNSEEELILALNKLHDSKIRKDLIFKGEERIKLLNLQRSEGLNLLSYKLEELKNII